MLAVHFSLVSLVMECVEGTSAARNLRLLVQAEVERGSRVVAFDFKVIQTVFEIVFGHFICLQEWFEIYKFE